MIEKKHKGHTVVMYDSIEDLPQVRHHKFNKYILLDSGIGSDLNSVIRHITTIRQMNQKGDTAFVDQQLLNMQQNIIFCIKNVSPHMMAFACLVYSIDGTVYDDLSDEGLQRVIKILDRHKFSMGIIRKWFEKRKKKLSQISKTSSQTSMMHLN